MRRLTPRNKFTSGQQFIQLWAAAASIVPYKHEVGQSVVDELLHIASRGPLRPQIPAGVWLWLHRQPSFRLVCWGHLRGSQRGVIQTVRAPGDSKIIKSYMLPVWTEWDYPGSPGPHEMCASIQGSSSTVGSIAEPTGSWVETPPKA